MLASILSWWTAVWAASAAVLLCAAYAAFLTLRMHLALNRLTEESTEVTAADIGLAAVEAAEGDPSSQTQIAENV